jgi:flagellar basal body-associated protein FliL
LILLTGKTNIQPSAKIENYSLNLSSLLKRKKKVMRSSCRKTMKRTTMQSCREEHEEKDHAELQKDCEEKDGSRKYHGERS